jgi:hypothetical protein
MLLRNLDVREMFDKWNNCHTCFIKLPIVTIGIVIACLYFLK